jgi:RHS repeat-associated protein
MLLQITRPDGKTVQFEYDALGRRTAKIFDGIINRYVWDGNVLLHEWSYELAERPQLVVTEDGTMEYDRKEQTDNITTWVYELNSFTPCGKYENGNYYSIISDYLGTPVLAFNAQGRQVWHRELDCYGRLRKGDNKFVPFLYPGQYVDVETGLAYNRFRYYDVDSGNYLSQDPIGLRSDEPNFYSYVPDTSTWTDIFGLTGFFNPIIWTAPSTGTGNTYRIYQQDVDWDKIDPKTGKTNLELATKGRAPIGSDGKSINLHHSKQRASGPLFEISGGVHTKYGHTNALHPYRVTPVNGSKLNPFDPVDRKLFDTDREAYWKHRAGQEKLRRASYN